MDKKPLRLNDLTKEEIEQMRLELFKHKEKKERPCRYCGKLTFMRSDQKYCSPKCRVTAFNEQSVLLVERLKRERDQWSVERQSLLKEIQELKKQVNKLKESA